jgi:putative restriction endonuclease
MVPDRRWEIMIALPNGQQFIDDAIESWADSEWTPDGSNEGFTASTYQIAIHARVVDPEFRATVLSRYSRTCPVSGVDHAGLLDVAHVLPWSEHPDQRADLANVLPLSKTHHAAFDRGLFTIDGDYRLRLNPSFETTSDVLQRTLVDRAVERIPLPDGGVNPDYFEQRNSMLEWF